MDDDRGVVMGVGRRKCPKCGENLVVPLGVFSCVARCRGCDSSVGMNALDNTTSLVFERVAETEAAEDHD